MQSTVDHYLESKHMFYSARYSDNLLVNLGGDFSKVSQTTLDIDQSICVNEFLEGLYVLYYEYRYHDWILFFNDSV